MSKFSIYLLAVFLIIHFDTNADDIIPIRVESWIVCEPSLQYVISIENISAKPLKIKYFDIEDSGKWLVGSLFLNGEGHRSFPHLHGSHFLTKAEEDDANRLVDVQPGDIKMIRVVLEEIYQVDISALKRIAFGKTIEIGNDAYYARGYSFDVESYCSGYKHEKHTHQIIKNDNWDKIKDEFEKQKREAESVPKYLRNF